MKKITYIIILAVIGMAAFFAGKFTKQTEHPKELEMVEMTMYSEGMYLEYSDGETFYTFWIPSEDLEESGVISTKNIVDWNTDGEELSVMTESGCEWYAYQLENVYRNRDFVPVEK